jgi:hypothetical protein
MKKVSKYLYILIFAASSSLAENCSINGKEAIQEARSSDYEFTFKKLSKDGDCQMGEDSPWFTVSASSSSETTCVAVLFSGKKLHTNWSLTRVNFNGTITSRKTPEAGALNPKLEFTIVAPPSTDRKAFLKEVILTGPDCSKWRNAFNHSN